MRKLYSIFLTVYFGLNLAQAQFSISTETAYLQHINAQNRKDLIADNIKNAEQFLVQVFQSPNEFPTQQSAQLLMALSYSYFLTDQPEQAIQRLLVQRCMFPSDSISEMSKSYFFELYFRNGFSLSDAQTTWENSQKTPADYSNRIWLAVELSTKLNKKANRPYILQLGQIARNQKAAVPYWYNQWEYLTRIKIPERKLKLAIDTQARSISEYQISDEKNAKFKLKVYRKSIHYYLRTDSKVRAKELFNEYKPQAQNFTENIKQVYFKMRIILDFY